MEQLQNDNMTSLDNLPDVLTAEIISKYLQIGYVKTLNLIKYGGIPHLKIGNTYRVSKKIFADWLYQPTSREITLN